MIAILQYIILVFGLFVVCLNGFLAWQFWRIRNPLSRAMAGDQTAQALAAAMTVIFALSSVLGNYGRLSPETVLVLRVCLFGPLCISSLYLWTVYRRITRGGDDG